MPTETQPLQRDSLSGVPLVSTLTSVSVICTSCMYADAWATVLLVPGVERGSQLAKARGLSAIFVLREGDELREITVGLWGASWAGPGHALTTIRVIPKSYWLGCGSASKLS